MNTAVHPTLPEAPLPTAARMSSPAPALPYAPAADAGRWPAETKAIVAAAVAVSVVSLATSGKVLWMWHTPALFRRSSVDAWPVFSVTTILVVSRVLFDAMVIGGAVAALARSRWARSLLLVGAAGLVVAVTWGTVRSIVFGPPGWSRY